METLTGLELAYCVVVLLLAYGLRGSTGFGGAVGMPLLALIIPIKVLVPVWTLLGIASSITIVGRERRHVSLADVWPFLPWCLVGIGAGLYLFQALEGRTLARGLGMLVLVYAAYALWQTTGAAPRRLPSRAIGSAASTLSGMVGAMFGTMATVFFVMYLDTRDLAKHAFRATMSAMLLALSTVRGIGYYAVGEFSRDSLIMFAAALPAMLAGIYIGDRVHLRMTEIAFRRLVVAILFACGIPLLLR
jgi:uncharacterized membrane protein YfcA